MKSFWSFQKRTIPFGATKVTIFLASALIMFTGYAQPGTRFNPPTPRFQVMQDFLKKHGKFWNPDKFTKKLSGIKLVKSVPGNGVTYFVTPSSEKTTQTLVSSSSGKSYSNGTIICDEQLKTFDQIFHSIDNSNTSDYPQIYPGAIYTDISVIGRPFSQQGLSGLQRLPMSIYIDLFDPTVSNHDSVIATIPTPSAGNIEASIQNLLSSNSGALEMAVVLPTVTEIQTSTEFNAKWKFSVSADLLKLIAIFAPEIEIPAVLADLNISATIGASAEASAKRKMHFYYAEMKEIFYTVSLNTEPWNLVTAATVPANAAVCNSVKYGRKWMFLIASFEEKDKIKLGLSEAINAAELAKTNASLSADAKAIINASFARGVFLGGNASDALAISFSNDFNKFKEFINKTPWTPAMKGFPVEYSFVYLDGTPLNVEIKTINPFLVQSCIRADETVGIEMDYLSPTFVVDAPGVPPDEELFGNITVEAFYTDAGGTKRTLNPTTTDNKLWSLSQNNAKKKSVGEKINGSVGLEYNFFPEFINTSVIRIKFNIRDKLESLEEFGHSNSQIENGVKYDFEDYEIGVKDIPPGGLVRTIKGKEGVAEVKVVIKFTR